MTSNSVKQFNRTRDTDVLSEFYSAHASSRSVRDVPLYHSTVHYIKSYLINNTDFVDTQGREPYLEEVQDALLYVGGLPLQEYVRTIGLPQWFATKYKKGFQNVED
jgi:hypothetical protein